MQASKANFEIYFKSVLNDKSLEDDVPKELLSQQIISDIEVDGSNNKWIATST